MSYPLDGALLHHEGPKSIFLAMSTLIPVVFSWVTFVLAYIHAPAIIQQIRRSGKEGVGHPHPPLLRVLRSVSYVRLPDAHSRI